MNTDKFFKYVVVILSALLLASVLAISYIRSSHQSELIELRNQIAERDSTIEVQKGVYSKLSLESDNIKKLLDSKDKQLNGILEELKSRRAEVLTATSMAVAWKKAYEGKATASQTETVVINSSNPEEKVIRTRVDFDKDFGYIVVNGHTITNPAEAFVSVKQGKPLKISLVVSEEKDGKWKTYATSSDENILIDIGLTAVNPKLIEEKWYEKISADGEVGIGSGVLTGIGLSYELGQFDVGPRVWLTTSGQFYGVGVSWHPFRSK